MYLKSFSDDSRAFLIFFTCFSSNPKSEYKELNIISPKSSMEAGDKRENRSFNSSGVRRESVLINGNLHFLAVSFFGGIMLAVDTSRDS